jgi:hypothetical protein
MVAWAGAKAVSDASPGYRLPDLCPRALRVIAVLLPDGPETWVALWVNRIGVVSQGHAGRRATLLQAEGIDSVAVQLRIHVALTGAVDEGTEAPDNGQIPDGS